MQGLKVGVLILGLVAGLLSLSQAAAQEETVAIGSATIAVGESGSVELAAQNIAEPGLAAWSIDVIYDPDVVVVVDCIPENFGVCNPNLASDTVRVTGASAAGLVGDTSLASLTFTCLAEGTSPLTVISRDFADGTLGRPQAIDVAIADGNIVCTVPATDTMDDDATPVVPTIVDTGTGPGDLGIDNWSLVIAGLIGAGIAWLIVGIGGAGLTAVTASALPWRRSPEPGGSIAGSDVPAPAARTTFDVSSGTKWLAAAQRRLTGADATAMPAFRRSRRRDR